MKGSSTHKLRQMASLIPILLIVCTLFASVAASNTGFLAFEKDSVVWDVIASTELNLKINITDVTDLMGIVLSVHWNSSILNCTAFTPGDLLPTGLPQATGWAGWPPNYAAGNLSEMANTFLPGNGPVSVSSPSWGWVITLTFEFVGTPPSPGSSIDTEIVITKDVAPSMDTLWTDNVPAILDFDKLDDPHIHIISAEIVPEFPLTVVTLALLMVVTSTAVVFKKKRHAI